MSEETSQAAQSGAEDAESVSELRLSLPRVSSLRKKRDYARVYAEGKRARGRLILVVAAPGLNPLSPRMGLSVGRKFNPSAVLRNRARRVLRDAFRLQRRHLPHLDMILIPVARGEAYRTGEIESELRRLTRKIARRLEEAKDEA